MPDPPDILLLAADRLIRAPLRAQLIEDGFEVIGTDTWPALRRHLRPGAKPLAAIVDLRDLPDADEVLRDLRVLMKPDRVIVLAAQGSVGPAEVSRLGYVVLRRPISIGEVVDAARALRVSLA
jgi:nucleoside-diphosphate-sugar epimerase